MNAIGPEATPGTADMAWPPAREATMGDLLRALWRRRLLILAISLATTMIAFAATYLMQPRFTAYAVLKPQGDEQALPGLGGALGSAAGLFGKTSEVADTANLLFNSRSFANTFVVRHRLQLPWFASKAVGSPPRLAIDPERYDARRRLWLGRAYIWFGAPVPAGPPGSSDIYERFQSIFDANLDTINGTLRLTATSTDPAAAKQWLDLLVADLNEAVRLRRYERARGRIAFIQSRLDTVNIIEVRQSLANTLARQIEVQANAANPGDLPLGVIETPIVPDRKSSPQRSLIAAAAFFLALSLTSIFIAVREAMRRGG